MIWKEIIGPELYVYVNGHLLYKKWLSTGQERLFHEGEGEVTQRIYAQQQAARQYWRRNNLAEWRDKIHFFRGR
jgi:hypothetical protein